jgi:release factor glutamine methyltransferase
MSASSPFPSGHDQAAAITRLRAAGCVFAEDEARLLISAARTPAALAAMVDRRAAGQPLEHVLGWAEFCGLRIAVDPGVFVPRRRTEFLVRRAAALARRAADPTGPDPTGLDPTGHDPTGLDPTGPDPTGLDPTGHDPTGHDPTRQRAVVVVDLCCGSGAVGAALAAALGQVELHAADIDPAAVRCARRNVAVAGGQVYQGDLYRPLPARLRGRVDILAANVPYVPSGDVGLLPPEARAHEPRVALDGGADGLDVLRRVAAGAPLWLAPGGHLLVETSERQAQRAAEAVGRDGLIPRIARSVRLNATVVIGTRPPGLRA